MRPSLRSADGFSAIWVAILMVFLVGATALAVDVSGFYQDARAEQTDADLTCLAGIPELPESPGTALARATEFAQRNWPELAAVTPSITATQAILDDGSGNVITITTPVDGQTTKMRVEVGKLAETSFAKVIGAQNVQVSQVAYCRTFGLGTGDLPFGAVPGGGFDGVLQNKNPCDTGNCRALDIPRADSNGSGKVFIRNVALGADRGLQAQSPISPIPPATAPVCTPATDPCTILDQNQGVSAGQLSDGMLRGSNSASVDGRLEFPVTPNTFVSPQNRVIDGDKYMDVLDPNYPGSFSGIEGNALTTEPKPPAWNDAVHGTWPADAITNGHVYYDGPIAKCGSPRLASIPIIANLDWDGDPATYNLPNGNSDPVKVIGFYLVIIEDPDQAIDLDNADKIKTASSTIVWLGPTSKCIGPNGPTKPWEVGDAKVTRLVDENG